MFDLSPTLCTKLWYSPFTTKYVDWVPGLFTFLAKVFWLQPHSGDSNAENFPYVPC